MSVRFDRFLVADPGRGGFRPRVGGIVLAWRTTTGRSTGPAGMSAFRLMPHPPDYQLERYAADPGFLSEVVRFDLPRLGTVSGLRGVHLQCHIGTDTVSLARL